MPRRLLVTHALPYANGPLHLGHLLGYIQADIWVRAQRMAGDAVHFVCADDAHGTPIMLAAEKAGVDAGGVHRRHPGRATSATSPTFGVAFDHYYTTHSAENRELATLIYTRLRRRRRTSRGAAIQQCYDPVKQMFLPDRYIKGDMPELRHAGPVRRQLRELRRDLRADRPEESALGGVRRHAGAARFGALLLRARRVRGVPARLARRRVQRTASRWPTAASRRS